MNDAAEHQANRRGDVVAGMALALAAALSVLAMAHHPTGIALAATLGRIVHGTLMALVVVMLAGFFRFSALRGFDRFAVALAFSLYAAAAIANLIAASINGFVVPALVERDAYEANAALLWTLNQTFAKSAVFAISAAFVLWGADLVARGGAPSRMLGAAGIAAGAAPASLLAAGMLDMHVAGAIVIYAAHALFTLLAGLYLASAKRG